jgi:hypothetical protein
MTKGQEWIDSMKDMPDDYGDIIEIENDIRTIVSRRTFIERDDDHGENK